MSRQAVEWNGRPVLVTGASGFLGGWLTAALLARGSRVVSIERDLVPNSYLKSAGLATEVTWCPGDISDAAVVNRAVTEYGVKTVFHLAAQALVPVAHRDPLSTFESNVRGTWILLEECRRATTISEVVVASSDKAYGEHAELPYREDAPLTPRGPYDVSKACADMIARSYAYEWNLPVVVTRCGNLFGGGDFSDSRLVPGVIRDVLSGIQPVIRSDGKPIRDYLYVEDAAEAYIAAAEGLAANREFRGQAFNFSLESPRSVLDMTRSILRMMGSDMEPDVRGEAAGEIERQYLDSAKARHDLGWAPRVGLDEGLTRTIEWYRRRA